MDKDHFAVSDRGHALVTQEHVECLAGGGHFKERADEFGLDNSTPGGVSCLLGPAAVSVVFVFFDCYTAFFDFEQAVFDIVFEGPDHPGFIASNHVAVGIVGVSRTVRQTRHRMRPRPVLTVSVRNPFFGSDIPDLIVTVGLGAVIIARRLSQTIQSIILEYLRIKMLRVRDGPDVPHAVVSVVQVLNNLLLGIGGLQAGKPQGQRVIGIIRDRAVTVDDLNDLPGRVVVDRLCQRTILKGKL